MEYRELYNALKEMKIDHDAYVEGLLHILNSFHAPPNVKVNIPLCAKLLEVKHEHKTD